MVLLKDLNELPEIKATVGNHTQDLNVATNACIGSRKKGNDVIPGRDIAGAHPEMDHVFAPVEEGEKGTMARPAVLDRIVAFLCPFLCSEVDEYLFKILPDVLSDGSNNPERDFTIRNKVSLDLKGTVLLKQYKGDPEYVYKNPLALIDSYYKEQSQDFHYRRRLQNRLFVVHHSYVAPERESYVRTLFDVKRVIFKRYVEMLMQPDHKIFDYMNGRKADLIMLVETVDGKIAYGFASENLKGEMIMRIFNKDTVL